MLFKGFSDKNLLDAVQARDETAANRWHATGGRHRSLGSFMQHLELCGSYYTPWYSLMSEYIKHGYVEKKPIRGNDQWGIVYRLELAPMVRYRKERARQAAVAILGLKRRMAHLMNKDVCILVAKMVYLNYENRYHDKWGRSKWNDFQKDVQTIGELLLHVPKCMVYFFQWCFSKLGFTHFSQVLLFAGMIFAVLLLSFPIFQNLGFPTPW